MVTVKRKTGTDLFNRSSINRSVPVSEICMLRQSIEDENQGALFRHAKKTVTAVPEFKVIYQAREPVFVTMQRTAQQIESFEQDGYLFFPNAFSAEETRVLKQAALDVYALQREEVWREKTGVARTAFAAHTYNDAFRRLGAHPRLIEPTGDAGSMLMFSSLLVHASPANISPMDRTIVYLSLCHVDNHIRQFKRPEWVAHRDFTPIEPLPDDTLRELIA